MLQIQRRTRLCDGTGQRYLRTLHREEARALQLSGAIEVDEVSGWRIVSFRLTGLTLAPTDIRRGSFGINRKHVPVGREYGLSGGVVYSHQRSLHDETERQCA